MSQFQRRHSFRDPKKFFIIATEGECTEQIYFEAIKPARDAAIQLKVLPARKGQSHLNHVLARLRKYEREAGAGPRDELWLVVDRDSWTESDLNAVAKAAATRTNYHLALSNPCFELWLVLHRCEVSGKSCQQLQEILRSELGSYAKNDYDVEALKDGIRGIHAAIARAERLDKSPHDSWPRQCGTRVYRLVRELVAG